MAWIRVGDTIFNTDLVTDISWLKGRTNYRREPIPDCLQVFQAAFNGDSQAVLNFEGNEATAVFRYFNELAEALC